MNNEQNAGRKIEGLMNAIGSNSFKEKFDDFVKFSLKQLETNRGEHIYFEDNPADPTVSHTMRDVNTAKLAKFSWLSYAMKHYNLKPLTKEDVKNIVSVVIPTSKKWSETHKQIICSYIPCPCCNMISLIVEVSAQGRPNGKSDTTDVNGWYQVDITPSSDGGEISVETYRLEKTLLEKNIFKR